VIYKNIGDIAEISATILRKALPIRSDFIFLSISQLQYLRRCAVKEIPRGARNKFTEIHKERLAREYSEAAKESTEVCKDLHGTFDDGLCETSDVDDVERGEACFEDRATRKR
jgi:hypothetical protein